MKVRCMKIISPVTGEDLGGNSPWLAVGKEYTVLAIIVTPRSGISICFQSDHKNEPISSTLTGFEMVSNYIPTNWVTKSKTYKEHNGYTEYYMMPESWMYDNFLEDLEDQEVKAMELFKKEAWIIYEEEEKFGRK